MKKSYTATIIALSTLALSATSSLHAVTVFSQDFSNPILGGDNGQATLGGSFAQANFGDIILSQNSSIVGEEVEVLTDSAFDGFAIIVDPANFAGVGEPHNLSFNITSLNLNSTPSNPSSSSVEAAIFGASGFDFVDTNNSLSIITFSDTAGAVSGNGTATSNLLAIDGFTTTGIQNLAFNFDGSSAIVVVIGSSDAGFPFPDFTIDDIEIASGTPAVPEPSSLILTLCSTLILCLRRRRVAR